jgi:alkylhydroperoxidase family enzyme
MGGKARVGSPNTSTGNVIRDSAMGLVPETVDAIIALNGAAWTVDAVRPAMMEMLRLRNANTVNCTFCKAARYDVAKADGLTEDRVQMIKDYRNSGLSETEKLALEFADAYLLDPGAVSTDLKRRLKAAFSDRQLAQMAVGLATFNAASRCAVSLGGMPEEVPVTEMSVPR